MVTRIEHDALGEVEVPAEALWGAQTQRAIANFPVSGLRSHPALVRAMVQVKKAAAIANGELGGVAPDVARAIAAACDEVLAGRHADQFPVDVFQMGAGTAFHMNVNEVLANLANQALGGARGRYDHVHPNDHVNRGQSTNDCFPTAMRVAAATLAGDLARELDLLAAALDAKAAAFAGVVKAGRTHLMDAAPVTLGQEMAAWARTVAAARDEVARGRDACCEVGLGGSAVGTGINTVKGFAARAVGLLADLSGLPLRPAADLRQAMQSQLPVGILSSAMRSAALELVRIMNDIRLLASGPGAGLREIDLPEVAPGSSIMPGKVNPSIPEMATQVMFFVAGLDAANALALQAGQLELNVMMPLMAFDLDLGLTVMANSVRVLRTRCVEGILANAEACRRHFEGSGALATSLTPVIGYEKAAAITLQAVRTGVPVTELLVRQQVLREEEVAAVFDPKRLTDPHGER
jgi:aspartate ammonia-lyase